MNDKIRIWSAEPLSDDVKKALERVASSDDVVRVAVMPDVHLAEDVCVGVAVATTRSIYPNAVGGDIGCGMATIRLDATREQIDRREIAARILAGFERRVPIMSHRAAHELPDELRAPLAAETLRRGASKSAPRQLGTLGRAK